MSTHNITIFSIIGNHMKHPKYNNICSYSIFFAGKGAIGVRATGVRLYLMFSCNYIL